MANMKVNVAAYSRRLADDGMDANSSKGRTPSRMIFPKAFPYPSFFSTLDSSPAAAMIKR
jgi:hypothetical protein